MKILHLAPLWFPIAKDSPGGIETYLPTLIEALEALGCENTLLASGDSQTAARLVPCVEQNVWDGMESGDVWEYQPYEQHQLRLALELADEFDVIHSHVGYCGYVLSGVPGVGERVLHTQHNDVTRDLEWLVSRQANLLFSTVSNRQARRLRSAGAMHCHVIPNGIDISRFQFNPEPKGGLAFLGRMEEDKGPDLAVHVARDLRMRLTLAGPMSDDEFFRQAVQPWLDDRIQYVGPVGHDEKTRLLGEAQCVLVPSRCDEGFGLVAVEAMAVGTPVVALANGALPELIEPGVSGYLAPTRAQLGRLVPQALQLDRSVVRNRAVSRFDVREVAHTYLSLYGEIALEASESRELRWVRS